MKNTLETRLGIFVALAVVAAVLILEMLGGIDRFQRGYHLNALFNNIQDLKVGDRVKMAGVEIGRVNEIQLTNNKVLVNMKLRKNVDVRTDSVAKVQFTGLMGQNFVGIEFGSPTATRAEEGTFLATAEQPDLSAVMAKIDNVATGVSKLTDSFTGEKIDNLLGPFTDFLRANQVPLTATIANLQKISTQISQGEGTVGKLIFDDSLYNSAHASMTNMQSLSDDIRVGLGDVRLALADARQMIAQVNAGQGTVGKLLKDETLYNETTASMTNLKEILQKINQGQGSVGKLVNDQDLYKNARMSLQKLDKATEGLEDQGPLSVIGLVVGNLF
ncbi:MAG TPA: MlaD family protein [Clostridia bacterium]|nr:MlaD family protein [Clostridia bacterium]